MITADFIDIQAQVTLAASSLECRDLLLAYSNGEDIEVAQLPGVKFRVVAVSPWESHHGDTKLTFDLDMTTLPEAGGRHE